MTRVKRLFNAWKDGGKDRGAPPSPDPSQPVRTDTGRDRVVEVLASLDGRHRVAIAKSTGGFRLYAETWAPEWETLGTATWLSNERMGGFAESLEGARETARDTLALLAGEDAPEE